MPARDLFEYAVIRIVPRVEREEFVNAGVILYCPKQRFLSVRCLLREERIKALCPEVAMKAIAEAIDSFQKISAGGKDCGPVGRLDMPSRFRWLTAVRSTVVQTSRVHSGLCEDATTSLEKLFAEMVA